VAILLSVFFTTYGLGQIDANFKPSQSESDELERMIEEIVANGFSNSDVAKHYDITQSSINSFFHFKGSDFVPQGVRVSKCELLGESRVFASVTVAVEEVLSRVESDVLDVLRFLKGNVEISVMFSVSAEKHIGQVTLESVRIGSIAIPSSILVALIRSYTRSDEVPNGFDLESRLSLPYGIERIQVDKGVVSVVQ
jgi:hypothetical protein